MATVNIQGVGPVNFPPDYTPERIKFAIENDILPRMKKAPAGPDAFDQSLVEKPTKLERLGRGFADITEGVTQGLKTLRDDPDTDAYTKARTEEIAAYERGRGPDAGMDLMRLGGNVAATAPAMLIPGGAATALGTRIAAGAAQGAAASASMFTPEGQSKLEQTLIGAGFGAAVPAVLTGGRKAIQALAARLPSTGTISLPAIEAEISLQLRQQGTDWNKLTQDVRAALLKDAQDSLKSGSTLDATQLARKADIESVGATGTRAAVTRDPKDWRTMQNLRGVDNVGEPIAARQANDAQAMSGYLTALRNRAGGAARTELEAGESAVGALRGQDATIKRGVDEAYGAARDNLGRASPMDAATFSRAANLALDEGMLGHYLPAEVRNILNDVTAGKIPFNVNTAVQIDSTLSAAQRSAGARSPQALAIGKVRDALNAAPIESNVGQDAKSAFDRARGMARDRFALHEDVPGMAAAVDDAAPDRFVKKFILDADARTLRNTIAQLRTSPGGNQAVADVKGHLLDSLLLKSTGATNVDDVVGRPFSGRNFAKALDGIQTEKLHAIFTPSEIESLRTLQRASKYLTEEVPFSDVNHSKTAAALANLLQKIGGTPMLGHLLSPIIGAGKIGMDWVKDAAARKQVAEVLLGSARGPLSQQLALPAPGKLSKMLPAVAGGASQEPRERANK